MIAMPWSAEMKIRLVTEMISFLSGLGIDSVSIDFILALAFGGR